HPVGSARAAALFVLRGSRFASHCALAEFARKVGVRLQIRQRQKFGECSAQRELLNGGTRPFRGSGGPWTCGSTSTGGRFSRLFSLAARSFPRSAPPVRRSAR